jgi:hypothetical protein
MIVAESAGVLQASFSELWYTVIQFLPAILVAAIVFVLGWIVGIIVGRVIEQVAHVLRLDEALRKSGLHDAVSDAGFHLHAGHFLGELVRWFIVVVFLFASLEILGLQQVNIFLQQVVLDFMPRVIIASLMIIVAALVAEAVRNVVTGSARAAGVRSANLAGSIAKWAVWVFGVSAALTQLDIAAGFIQAAFTALVFGLALAFGLAFGLGGKDAAARVLERMRSDMSHHEM